MRKSTVLLVIALLCSSTSFALSDSVASVSAPDPTVPTVTISQQQFDSLVSAASRSNQMEIIAKQEAERLFDFYTTHVSWVVGLFGVLVALFGAVLPYLINRRFEKIVEGKIAAHDKKIDAHDSEIQESNKQIKDAKDSLIKFVDETEKKMKSIEEKTRKGISTSFATQAILTKSDEYAIKLFDGAIFVDPEKPITYRNRAKRWMSLGKDAFSHPDKHKGVDWRECIRKALDDIEKASTLNLDDKVKHDLDGMRMECKELFGEK